MKELEKMFKPNSVAVIGASNKQGKVGNMVIKNLLTCGYVGKIYPVNPKEETIEGLKNYHNINEIEDSIDLAVITIPAGAVNQSVIECGEKGIKNIVILTAGFKEVGQEGAKLEKELFDICEKYQINVLGPNCIGNIDTHTPVSASFCQLMPNKGDIAFISQSGAMLVALLDWSIKEGIGFSKVVSIGNKVNVSEVDVIRYLANDPDTSVILCYLEEIANDPKYLDVMKEVTSKKPVVVLKSGSSAVGAKAASSHTGALAGNDFAFDAAFEQSGIIRVDTMQDLFDVGRAFSKLQLPNNTNVAVITNAGGGGVVTADSIEKYGLNMAKFSDETIEKLKQCMPPEGSINNPIDVLGDASPERYQKTLEAISQDDNVDSIIVITCPTAAADPIGIGKEILNVRGKTKKPMLVVNMGGITFEKINEELRQNGIPTYVFPETAVKILSIIDKYVKMKNTNINDTRCENIDVEYEKALEIINNVKQSGRKALLGSEAYKIAKCYGIDASPIYLAKDVQSAVGFANEMGYPVVLKIASDKILHKTDIGGVRVNLHTAEEVEKAFEEIMINSKKAYPDIEPEGIEIQKMLDNTTEVIIGMVKDRQFGPVIAFGMGGIYVNLIKDVCFKIANGITLNQIHNQINKTKAGVLLKGYRGSKPADISKVSDIIMRIAKLTLDFEEINELDINPVFVYEDRAIAVDIKIALK